MSFGRISCDRCLLFLVNQGVLTHINVRGGCSTVVFPGSLNKIPWDDVCAHLTVLLDSEFYFKEQFVSENAEELRFPGTGKSPLCKDVSLGKRKGGTFYQNVKCTQRNYLIFLKGFSVYLYIQRENSEVPAGYKQMRVPCIGKNVLLAKVKCSPNGED